MPGMGEALGGAMMNRRGFLVTSTVVAVTGFGRRPFAAEPVKIGAINPYSGGPALYGDDDAGV